MIMWLLLIIVIFSVCSHVLFILISLESTYFDVFFDGFVSECQTMQLDRDNCIIIHNS